MGLLYNLPGMQSVLEHRWILEYNSGIREHILGLLWASPHIQISMYDLGLVKFIAIISFDAATSSWSRAANLVL